MNLLLSQFLSLRQIEYLVVNGEFNILEISPGVKRFADCPDEVKKGKDVRLGFPELVGVEDILLAILEKEQESFELKGIGRFSGCTSPFYINISVIKTSEKGGVDKQLIIFIEDVTERMV